VSGSSSKTSTTSSQSTSVRNLNLQDTGGFTAADNKNSTITAISVTNSTDAGALAGGVALGKAAINSDNDISHAAIDLGSKGLDVGQQIANAGLDNARAAYESGLTFGNNALDTVHALASEFSSQNANLAENALAGFQTIAQQNSASESTQIQKVALYAIGAAVALVVLPKLFK
jgi:hypothetical protein